MSEDELSVKIVDPTNSETFQEFPEEIRGIARGSA